jgi:hypothetical protein
MRYAFAGDLDPLGMAIAVSGRLEVLIGGAV